MRNGLPVWLIAALLLAACSRSPPPEQGSPRASGPAGTPLALIGATLIDGTGAAPVADAVVVLDGGTIACAGPETQCRVADGARVIDLTGRWITPGIVDAHVHFSQTAWGDGRPDALDVRSLYPFEAVQHRQRTMPERYFRSYLCSGVTAVFDVGGFPWTWGLRERFRDDPFAPNLAAAGPLISHVSPPEWVLPAERQIIELTDSEAGRVGVRYVAANASDAVKVWFIRPAEDMRSEIETRFLAVAEEARTYGIQLIVHATALREAKFAASTGARVLVHSVGDQPVDEEFIAMLTDPAHEVIYTPTLTVRGGYVRMYQAGLSGVPPMVDDPNRCVDADTLAKIAESAQAGEFMPFGQERLDAYAERAAAGYGVMVANLKTLYERGATIAMGTDAGNPLTVAGPSVYAEMEAMQAAGMPPMAVIVAATRNSARAMNREVDLGTIEPGKSADLLVLASNPEEDVAHFRDLDAVIRAGKFHSQHALQRPERGAH